jgi:hypothetical protein
MGMRSRIISSRAVSAPAFRLGQQVGGDVLVDHRHVTHAPVAPAQGEGGDLDRHAPALGDMDVLDVARVVPEGGNRHGLAGERTVDEVEHAALRRLLVAQRVVAGRRLAAEDLAELRVGQDAVAVGRVDLEAHGGVGEQSGEQGGGIIDARQCHRPSPPCPVPALRAPAARIGDDRHDRAD